MTDRLPGRQPYGTWPSPISAADLAAGAVRLTDLQADGDDLCWIETRPAEGGRQVVVRWRGGTLTEVTPPDTNARTRVHEYGGGAFAVRDGTVVFSDFHDQRLYRIDDGAPRPITPEPDVPAGHRYADAHWAPGGRWLVCVRERHGSEGEPRNEVVAVPADGGNPPVVLASGRDFYAAPRVRDDGGWLAWLAWDHPDLPWDGAEVHVARLSLDGEPALRDDRRVAGGDDVSAIQPAWARDGALLFGCDRSGFWNIERFIPEAASADGRESVDGRAAPITAVAGDIGAPAWQFGDASFAALDDGRIVAAIVERARARLALVHPATGAITPLASPYTRIDHLTPFRGGAAFLAASPQREGAVVVLGRDGRLEEVRAIGTLDPEDPEIADVLVTPEGITFPTAGGEEAHAFFYPPRNGRVDAPDSERPPLLVITHGGPTGNAYPVLSPAILYWTSRGFAVVDVNYRGSTGYGRAYRDALRGNWGIHDVDDAMAAARFLAARGAVDPDRLAIRGGSAGGFTTLACLVRPDNPFAAGANYYGVADLEPFVRTTHKFEARYLDRLVAPYPEGRDIYRERSPLTHVDRLRTPLIVLQGAEDAIVPPEQSRLIVAAAVERGIRHVYLEFPGEQHGFRRAEHITRALEAELAFYGEVLGFEPADTIDSSDEHGLGHAPHRSRRDEESG